jgi:PHD/YefM family antitoxin component YafN of YafNO toxin-antitoxin module
MNKQVKSYEIAFHNLRVEVVAAVPVARKPSIEETKNDDDVILLSREDFAIDDETTNEAKTPPILPESNIASNDAATSNNDDNSTNGESKPSARPKGNVVSNAMNDSQGCISLLTTSNEDTTVFQDILCQLNVFEFPTLDDVSPAIEACEKKSGNRLSIQCSLIGEFCLYILEPLTQYCLIRVNSSMLEVIRRLIDFGLNYLDCYEKVRSKRSYLLLLSYHPHILALRRPTCSYTTATGYCGSF